MLRSIGLAACLSLAAAHADADDTPPLVGDGVVFGGRDGALAVEAEHYFKQELTDARRWRLATTDHGPGVTPDGDDNHAHGASGGAYLEALPDTRRTHDDPLVRGENFFPNPGEAGVLHYRVHVDAPGRYYVWARIYSTGTEDNGLHVGLNGEWPPSGARLQWIAKRQWRWDSKQRTKEKHGGVPGLIWLDVPEPGEHVVTFSIREDGAEFDKWFMTLDPDFPHPGESTGPDVVLHRGTPPDTPTGDE